MYRKDQIRLTQAPRIHYTRPSADPLFESVAEQYGEKAVLVVLSGMGRNGSTALPLAKMNGCYIIAQDKATAKYSGMQARQSGLVASMRFSL